ncbi:S66 peptidase family protein [Gorillibacterium timonense]|uniref:S66 peptidase family protein n=1 Tax=Gorillibacterium timonense TaxID=1689269 RepID=UPI00071CDF8D|nr:LD-carboxypeptidase [Gorillibacterium timonense]
MADRSSRIKPQALTPGDTVGITAPASPGDREAAVRAACCLENLGLKVRFGETLQLKRGYLAGDDRQRAEELNGMFADPDIKAIVCSRGGYGTGRIADRLDYELIRANPKIFWGYSDITYLHAAIGQKSGLVTFHGPMLIDLSQPEVHPLTLQSFQSLLQPLVFRYTEEISPLEVLVEGEAEGEIVGGNLSLLASGLGTPYEIDTAGKLLFIEDIDEEPYSVDRMLNQLRLAGKLADAAGIVVGDFHDCEPKKRLESLTLQEVLNDYLIPAGKPCLSGFRIGHCSPNIAIPFGVEAVLRTSERVLECKEPAVQTEGG